MSKKSYFLIKGRKDEKDILISYGGYEFGSVYVYELKESHSINEIIKDELQGNLGSEERAANMEVAISKWINKKYGREPSLIK
jgi:hypothetical protein